MEGEDGFHKRMTFSTMFIFGLTQIVGNLKTSIMIINKYHKQTNKPAEAKNYHTDICGSHAMSLDAYSVTAFNFIIL